MRVLAFGRHSLATPDRNRTAERREDQILSAYTHTSAEYLRRRIHHLIGILASRSVSISSSCIVYSLRVLPSVTDLLCGVSPTGDGLPRRVDGLEGG